MYLKQFIRSFRTATTMAKSKYEYVKKFEIDNSCLPECYIVARIDGKGFHRFAECHNFEKPNDERALNLMTSAAQHVMQEFNDIILAYGQSDEYSFVFRTETDIYQRRINKIISLVGSTFTSAYIFHWSSIFTDKLLQYPPVFDNRISLIPTSKILRDYLSWRQVDCHINNLHNTCFWKLVQERGLSPSEAQKKLQTMLASDKNELLFSEFQTNYNNLPPLFRKGTVIVKEQVEVCPEPSAYGGGSAYNSVRNQEVDSMSREKEHEAPEEHLTANKSSAENVIRNQKNNGMSKKKKYVVKPVTLHVDIIGDEFWKERPHLLLE